MSVRRSTVRLSAGLLLVAACAMGPATAFAEQNGGPSDGGGECSQDASGAYPTTLALSSTTVTAGQSVELMVNCFPGPARSEASVKVVGPNGFSEDLETRTAPPGGSSVWSFTAPTDLEPGEYSFVVAIGDWANNTGFTLEAASGDEEPSAEPDPGEEDDGEGEGTQSPDPGQDEEDDEDGDLGSGGGTAGDEESDNGNGGSGNGDGTADGPAGDGGADGSGSGDDSGNDGDSTGDTGSGDGSGKGDRNGGAQESGGPGSSGDSGGSSSGTEGDDTNSSEPGNDAHPDTQKPAPSAGGDPAQGSRPDPQQPPEQPGSATDDLPDATPEPSAEQERSAALAVLMTSLFAHGVSSGGVGTSPEDARAAIDPSADASEIPAPAEADGAGDSGSGNSDEAEGARAGRSGTDAAGVEGDGDELAETGTDTLVPATLAGLALLGGGTLLRRRHRSAR